MLKVIKKITDILFVLIIAVLINYFILRSIGKIEIFEVETGSMEDGIHPGDYVLIFQKDLYKVGDIVTYTKDGYYITHRIIREDSSGIITKGDANNAEDEKINKSDIVGKVILIGGVLNIVINYKFAIVSLFLALYLFSSYFSKGEEDIIENEFCDKEDMDNCAVDKALSNGAEIKLNSEEQIDKQEIKLPEEAAEEQTQELKCANDEVKDIEKKEELEEKNYKIVKPKKKGAKKNIKVNKNTSQKNKGINSKTKVNKKI